jgi:cyanophycin synthetase
LDDSTEELLKSQRITLNDILPQGKQVFLKQTANLSTGGTSEDVTDLIHPEIIALAERVARITGLDICGIDFIAEDITRSVKRSNGVVIEVNAAPGFRMHTNPFKGKPRPVGEAVVNMLFPEETNGRIPIIAITGTNGKTTTTRIIAHIVKTAGYTVGSTTTDGIYIDGNLIEAGDCTGPSSTAKVLSDKTVDFAVLECARGGILRSGLGYDYCDVGVVTNVADDHIGIDGINSVQEMALVKSVVPETIGKNGYAVLNENNEFTLAMAESIKCNVALFSINHRSKKIAEHCKHGGIACIFKDGKIYLLHGQNTVLYEMAENIPITFGGKAVFMIENVMAAILAAYTKNIPVNVISSALHSFIPTYETTPGRMNLYHFKNFSFMLDYAHNLHGMNAIGSYIKQTKASPKVGIITSPGDRRNEDIYNVGRAAAEIFDRIIIRIDEDTRGRKLTEIVDLLYNGIRSKNRNMNVEIIAKEAEALNYALSNASEGSLIVLFSEDIAKANELLMDFKHREDEFIYTDAREPDYVLRVGKNNLFEYTRKKSFSNRR